jgi:hypothetical protein
MSDGDFHDRVGREHIERQGDHAMTRPLPPPVPQSASAREVANAATDFGVSRWAERGELFYGVGETRSKLPAGLYRCAMVDGIGAALIRQRVETDKLLELPDDAGASILAEFAQFWTIADKFRQRGYLHKRGFLLWGPPGSGKTSTLQLMIAKLIAELDGIVLLLEDPHTAAACLQIARKIEPARPMIAVMEDIDALVSRHGEQEYLALLDGEAQVDNIVFLSTTNYPERLDPRFVDRPSRFDTIRHIDMPSAAARRMYLEIKEPGLTPEELEAWVARSDGFSVAHLKELIVAVKCFGQPLEDVVKRLEAMRERRSRSDEHPNRRTGFILGGHRIGNGHAGAR